uniref:Uncharacterized protein n=1 Tax=Globisporangium ultimum (strain ATCC 200006 / CBS 805.95 / DAOM BR144) TaxID=431595 RepID=K3X7P6_GLOUD
MMQRTLIIDYWDRSEECLERKWDHMDMIDEVSPSREEHILSTTLRDEHIILEPNMFPYTTPDGIEHWTLWSRNEMGDQEVEAYVSSWITENAPHVKSWNFDENSSRSIDLFHVHVYFQVEAGQRVLLCESERQ